MSDIGTFGSFTVARLGMYAAQKGLGVTGNNIANINTKGYTRQSLDQVSLRVGSGDRYQSRYNVRTGTGVLCVGVSQLRDPYLDIRYRAKMADVGSLDGKLAGLEDLASVLDEVGKGEGDGVIEKQLSALRDALAKFGTENAGSDTFDTLVRTEAQTLTKLFNKYAKDLQTVKENTELGFKNDVDKVNSILTEIRDLNASIRLSEIHGDGALEQRDQRNLLIDELSQYMKIDVTYEPEDIGGGQTIDNLVIKLGNANPDVDITTDSATLVDGIYATQLQARTPTAADSDFDANYNLDLAALTDKRGRTHATLNADVPLHDNDLYGSLQSTREMLTEKGEFSTQTDIDGDPSATKKRGIPYYMHSLDALANKIATKFNEANSPSNGTAPKSGDLFRSSDPADPTATITAANISISDEWANGTVRIVNSFTPSADGGPPPSTANDNILHMIAMFETKYEYIPTDTVVDAASGTAYINGTFQEMLSNINVVLAADAYDTSSLLDSAYISSIDLDTSRDAVSSVDLNDEAMSLMQYQKSYSAAARLMTTLDEVLDKLINGTGIAGR